MSKATNGSQLVLYKVKQSPPSSAVRMLGDILALQFDLIEPENWYHSPEFKKLTPMCTIPVLQDKVLTICESHAILKYLTSKYGCDKREKLYPNDFNTRAIIDQLMFYDAGVIFVRIKVPAMLIVIHGLKEPSEQHKSDIDNAFSLLEAHLSNRLYIATDHLTIADLSLGSTATAIQAIHKLDENKFPLTSQWLTRLNDEEFFKKINQPTVFEFNNMISTALERNNK